MHRNTCHVSWQLVRGGARALPSYVVLLGSTLALNPFIRSHDKNPIQLKQARLRMKGKVYSSRQFDRNLLSAFKYIFGRRLPSPFQIISEVRMS